MTVVEMDSVIVGFLATKPALKMLDQLFVLPAPQGIGVGSRLLEIAMSELPDGFSLRTAADNDRARRFYEACGLSQSHLEPHPVFGHLTAIYLWRP